TGRDLLIAAGAPVGLARPGAGEAAHDPVAVRPGLDALGPGHRRWGAGALTADPARAHVCRAYVSSWHRVAAAPSRVTERAARDCQVQRRLRRTADRSSPLCPAAPH